MSRTRVVPVVICAVLVASTFGAPAVFTQAGGTYSFNMTIPLDPGGTWTIGDIWHLPWSDEVDDEARLAEADARLIFRDDAGAVLHSRLIARAVMCNGDCHEIDSALVELPAQPAARRAELYTIDGLGNAVDLKATRVRSPNMPQVEILSPHAGQVLTDGLVIEWRGDDADGDSLAYWVLYRPSVGEWQQTALGGETTETRYVFERGGLPADQNATIAIQANDGFNTVEATVTGLKVEVNLPPELYITSPHDGAVYLEGSSVMLIAYADDPEDGELPVSWASSRDGPIEDIEFDEWTTGSVGMHRLTASATDSAGVTVSETVTIYIGTEPQEPVYLPLAVRKRGIGG